VILESSTMPVRYYPTIEREIAGVVETPVEWLYVLSVPVAAAVASVSGPKLAGLHYTGFLWTGYLAVGTLLVLRDLPSVRFPIRRWLPLLALAGFSLSWAGVRDWWNVQALLQMAAALVVGMVASMAVRKDEQLVALERSFMGCLGLIAASFVFFYYGPGQAWHDPASDTGFCVRPTAMTLTLTAAVALTSVQFSGLRAWCLWGAGIAVCVLTGSRTATLGMLLAPLVNPLGRRPAAKAALAVAMMLLAVALFYTPIFQERFFGDDGGTFEELREGDFSGSGRFNIWPLLLEEAERHPLFGLGFGTSSDFLIENQFELTQPLNDYVRIGFELGLVGLILYLVPIAMHMADLGRSMRSASETARGVCGASIIGLIMLLAFSLTENTLVYNLYFTHPLFVLIGAAYGAERES
jgi:O-antigen ligase